MSDIPARDLEALVELFERSDWDELHLEMGQVRLDLSKQGVVAAPLRSPMPSSTPASARAVEREPPAKVSAPAPAPAGVSASRERRIPEGWIAVRAPNLGTFYRSPKPGAPPFVEVGQLIAAGTEICLLEVMKLFTTVTARVGGVVREICATDGEMIERDQPLVLIEPKELSS
jgi:acetyl-CoA carboxylase biotin carboxyl carrier protein